MVETLVLRPSNWMIRTPSQWPFCKFGWAIRHSLNRNRSFWLANRIVISLIPCNEILREKRGMIWILLTGRKFWFHGLEGHRHMEILKQWEVWDLDTSIQKRRAHQSCQKLELNASLHRKSRSLLVTTTNENLSLSLSVDHVVSTHWQ
jgi:hypothetical protein